MKTSKIILKATLLSTCIFWLIIFSGNFESLMIPFMFLSLIPISLCCATTIMITILPFFRFKTINNKNNIVFKKYFPFYAIVCFSLCFYGVLIDLDLACFYVSAFFTTMQSWVWFGKEVESKS